MKHLNMEVNMNGPSMYGEDDDMEGLYSDPSLDALYTIMCRDDDKEWKRKEMCRRTKRLLR